MKTKPTTFILAAACGLLTLGGCASMESSNQESLLSAAGFRSRAPETEKQKTIYAEMPPYKVQRATVNGKVYYAYKDEKTGLAYVGGEPEYQRYQQLAVQQRIASDRIAAAEMNRAYAYRWYGAYGGYDARPGMMW